MSENKKLNECSDYFSAEIKKMEWMGESREAMQALRDMSILDPNLAGRLDKAVDVLGNMAYAGDVPGFKRAVDLYTKLLKQFLLPRVNQELRAGEETERNGES